ncbi:MAG: hypothetical protein IPO21_15415 [Bacteroidales bacterium]|nr:hypothetical protein [Bacteroidales bacterium]
MKKRGFVLIAFLLLYVLSYSQVLSKKITVKAENEKVFSVLKRVLSENKINFSVNSSLIPEHAVFSGNFANTPLRDVLTQMLDGLCLNFTEMKEQIIIFNNPSCSKKASTPTLITSSAIKKTQNNSTSKPNTVYIIDTILQKITDTILKIDTIIKTDTIYRIDTCWIEKKKDKKKHSSKLLLGIDYAPIIFGDRKLIQSDEKYTNFKFESKYSSTLGIMVGVNRKNISISTGCNYSLMNFNEYASETNYKINETKNISLVSNIITKTDTSSYYELVNNEQIWHYKVDTFYIEKIDTITETSFDTITTIVNHESENKVHYIQIPLNFIFKVPITSKFDIFINGGVKYSYLLHASINTTLPEKQFNKHLLEFHGGNWIECSP